MNYCLTHQFGIPNFETGGLPKIKFFQEGIEFEQNWKKYFIEYSQIIDYSVGESEENIKKGWSTGKALGGAILAGGVGILAGFAGSQEVNKTAYVGIQYKINGIQNRLLFKNEKNPQLAYAFINELATNRLGNSKLKLYSDEEQNIAKNKKRTINLLICIFLGGFGVHRFMRGDKIIGVIYLFSYGILGFGLIYDIYLILTDKW